MRYTTTFSSIATVVARAFGFEVAGNAVRKLLHHLLMREPLHADSGYQPEPWSQKGALDERQSQFINRLVILITGKPAMSWRSDKLALAVCSNPASIVPANELSTSRIRRRG